MDQFFFISWESLLRTAVLGALGYSALVAMLRVSGKRTLGQMNIFDLAVTVAFGSILATTMLSRDIALLDGVLAFAVLIAGQFVIAWLSVRVKRFRRLIRAEPSLLFYRGEFQVAAMQRERIIESEVRAAVRSQGFVDLEDVGAVVLETNGALSVIGRKEPPEASALQGLDVPAEARDGRS